MIRTPRSQPGRNSQVLERNAARYETSALPPFNFGEVLNLSASGMRVRRTSRPAVTVGAVEKFVIVAGAGPLVLRGRIMWVRRQSLFGKKYDFGVQFVNVDKVTADRLIHLGQFGFDIGVQERTPEDTARRKILAAIEVEDLYPILGVSPQATEDEIAAAYRGLARRWHPDVCTDPRADEQMSRIGKAYRVLRDRDLRAKYDEMRAASAQVTGGDLRQRAA